MTTLSAIIAPTNVVTTTGTQTLSNKTLVAPALGTPASGNLSNCTGIPAGSAATPTVEGTVYGKMTASGGTPYLTALGYNAAASTTGELCTAVGVEALYNNTSGQNNSAFGYRTLFANSSGSDNCGFGRGSLRFNTTGVSLVAIGNSALNANTTGQQNTAVGVSALLSNTTASNNTAVGYQAGYTNSTGIQNVFIGNQAGYFATGRDNTFVGTGAGGAITSGTNNTIIGQYDGNGGSLDIRTASNYIVLSDGDGNPRGIFDGSGSFFVGTTSTPASSGKGSAFVSDGEDRWQLIQNQNTTDARALQSFRNPNGAIGSIQTSGSATSFVTSSDYRLKNTIAPMTGALAKVALLKPCTYKWNCDGSDGQGFIAHELAEVVPQCVTGEKDAVNEDGSIKSQGIDTSFLVATLTAAIQELKAEFDAYKASHP